MEYPQRRSNFDDLPRAAYSVLVGVDYSDVSQAVVSEAVKQARVHPGSRLHVLHALPSSAQIDAAMFTPGLTATATGATPLLVNAVLPDEHAVSAQLKAFIDTVLARLQPGSLDSLTLSTHVRAAEPADALIELAAELRSDLIVVGTHARSGLERLLLGSVAEAVVRRAPCPVLVVPPPHDVKR